MEHITKFRGANLRSEHRAGHRHLYKVSVRVRNTAPVHRRETVTVLSKPQDVLHTVRRRDGLHPSITRIVYGRNRIRLRWPALSEHHGIPKTSSTTSRGLTDLMTASLSIRHLQMAMTVSAVQLSHKHLTGAQQT
jgi:hypothetical protein